MSVTDRNERRNTRRIDRMRVWISHAKAISGEEEAHIRFLFYWIAYEAAYHMNETGESEGRHWKERRKFHQRLASHDRGGKLQSILHAQKDDVVGILELRQAHPSFWRRLPVDKEVRRDKEWESVFQKRVQKMVEDLNDAVRSGIKRKIKGILNDLFENLSIVRHQIVHGGSAGSKSQGRTQVILGARLLSEFVPCFHEVIEKSIKHNPNEDWGEPPFPHVGLGPDDKCSPPWLSWQPGSDPAQGAT